MIRFHKSAQDGWLQKQFFLQRLFAAALSQTAPVEEISPDKSARLEKNSWVLARFPVPIWRTSYKPTSGRYGSLRFNFRIARKSTGPLARWDCPAARKTRPRSFA